MIFPYLQTLISAPIFDCESYNKKLTQNKKENKRNTKIRAEHKISDEIEEDERRFKKNEEELRMREAEVMHSHGAPAT